MLEGKPASCNGTSLLALVPDLYEGKVVEVILMY
jgi:hypothetical protein